MRDQLDLKGLPRAFASAGFTAEVLLRVRTDEARPPVPRLRFAAVCVAVVVASAAAGAWWTRQSAPEPAPLTAETFATLNRFPFATRLQEAGKSNRSTPP